MAVKKKPFPKPGNKSIWSGFKNKRQLKWTPSSIPFTITEEKTPFKKQTETAMSVRLPNATVLKLAKAAGTLRLSADAYKHIRRLYARFMQRMVTPVMTVTLMRKSKTVSDGDVREGIRVMGGGVLGSGRDDSSSKAISLAIFIRQLRALQTPTSTKLRFSSKAVQLLRGFMTEMMINYLRSSTGLQSHQGYKTVGKRDITNVWKVCTNTNWKLFNTQVEDLPPGFPNASGPPKKKKKSKKTIRRSGSKEW